MLELRIKLQDSLRAFTVNEFFQIVHSVPEGVSLRTLEDDGAKFFLFLGEESLMCEWLRDAPMSSFSHHFERRTLPAESRRDLAERLCLSHTQKIEARAE